MGKVKNYYNSLKARLGEERISRAHASVESALKCVDTPVRFFTSAMLFNMEPFAICASVALVVVVYSFRAPANVLGSVMLGLCFVEALKFVFQKYLDELVEREVSRPEVNSVLSAF